jgi:outer membrane protein assembly factor BamB
VADGSVFVGSDDGHLYAVDTRTGTQRWSFETGGPVRSSPAVFHDRVIVGSDDHGVYAIDIETGDVVWDFETGDRVRAPPLVDVQTAFRVADHLVAVGSYDGMMYVFEPRTGELIHRQGAGGPIKVSAVTGVWSRAWELIWGAEDSKRHYWIPSRRDDPGLSPTVRYDLDSPQTAATTWSPPNMLRVEEGYAIYEIPGDLTRRVPGKYQNDWVFESDDEIRSSPALGPFVYIGSLDGNLYAIDRDSGDPEWTFETGDKIESSPALAGDGVYVSSTDGRLYGVNATSGELLGSFATGDAIHSSPAVTEGTVYVGSDDGFVYALSGE